MPENEMYKVVLLNDNETYMHFVIEILEKFFEMEYFQSWEIMNLIHVNGSGLCGVFPKEIAQNKVNSIIEYARNNNSPLQCIMVKSDE